VNSCPSWLAEDDPESSEPQAFCNAYCAAVGSSPYWCPNSPNTPPPTTEFEACLAAGGNGAACCLAHPDGDGCAASRATCQAIGADPTAQPFGDTETSFCLGYC
jgi:hypothetical protein